MRSEIERVRRVSDTLCSGHASLRDKFRTRALLLDLAILALSAWLVALAFVDAEIGAMLTPFGLGSPLWVGLLAVGTFVLTLVQLKTDWKGLSDAHKRSCEAYAEVKREAGYLLSEGALDDSAARKVLARYDMASAVGVALPEREFLTQKQRHKIKVEISKHLDTHPAASIFITRCRLWWRDNMDSRS